MPNRVLVTLNDELDKWVVDTARKNSLPKATFVSMLVAQARQSIEMLEVTNGILKYMSASATKEQQQEFFKRLASGE